MGVLRPRAVGLVNLGVHLIKEFEATHQSLLHTVDSRARGGSGDQRTSKGKENLRGQRRPLIPETQPTPQPSQVPPTGWGRGSKEASVLMGTLSGEASAPLWGPGRKGCSWEQTGRPRGR